MSTSGRGPALASGRSRPLVESYVEHGDPLARKIRAALKTSLLRTELVHQDHELESRMRGEPPVRFGWGATAKSRSLSTSITQDGGFGKIEDAPTSLREMLPPSAPEACRQRQGHIVVFMRMNLSLTFNTWLRPRPSETPTSQETDDSFFHDQPSQAGVGAYQGLANARGRAVRTLRVLT